MPKLWLKPSIIKNCISCPAFEYTHNKKDKCKCNEFNSIITREMLELIFDGEFPEFCKLEDVGW